MKRIHEYFMNMALSLALRGTGRTLSNPRVGCILVKGDKVVGRGYHKTYGQEHAEVNALLDAGAEAKGSTAYVTLEPCSHYGKTPPCAPRLVNSGVKRVFIGSLDPNPKVNGKGIEILKQGGVEVVHGILKDECDWTNRGFFTRITRNRPWITLKAAIGLDGKMCLENGESKWISSSWSRRIAHLKRSENDAVMVGKGTVMADDPQLTVRACPGISPLKVIIDPRLEIFREAKVFHNERCIVYSGCNDRLSSADTSFRGKCVEVRGAPMKGSGLDLTAVMEDLGRKGINYLLVEGGPSIISSLLKEDLVDEVVIFVAPRIMGQGKCFSDSMIFQCMESTISLRDVRIGRMGNDLILEGII